VEALQTLFDAAPSDAPQLPLPEALRSLYGGPLAMAEDLVYSNFVSSLDGVVALPGAGVPAGPTLSGRSEADRFVMGLLRAVANCVLVGAQTLREDAGHLWTPGYIYPPAAGAFATLRAALGLAPEPALCVLTRSGELDRSERVFREQQPLVLEGELELAEVLRDLRGRGWRRVLCEGGPNVIGELVRGGLLEEAFITVSPVLAGRGGTPRPGMVEGVELLPERGIWGRLAGVRRHQDHLFLRYRLHRARRE
jgi:riboflavin biosynthesis pyrimidine reductase